MMNTLLLSFIINFAAWLVYKIGYRRGYLKGEEIEKARAREEFLAEGKAMLKTAWKDADKDYGEKEHGDG